MTKSIVYLDQNFLSGMVKSRPVHVASLFPLLSRLVDQEKIVCPRSAVHDQESDLDDRIAHQLHRVVDELAGGVRFESFHQIVLGQSQRALQSYLGLSSQAEGAWHHAYNRDPHEPLVRPRISARIPSPDDWAEGTREMKKRVQEFRAGQTASYAARVTRSRCGTFEELRQEQLEGIVKWNFGASGEADSRPLAVPLLQIALSLLHGLASDKDVERYARFFYSPEFASIPSFDIWASLEAGFLYHERNRKPKPSDVFDQLALSLALPYVDIVTTDQSMKGMLQRVGLNQRHRVDVYSPTQADVAALAERLGD